MLSNIKYLLILFIFNIFSTVTQASVYEQNLASELFSDKNMCQWVDCPSVMPGASTFSERKGNPYYVEAYAENGDLIGYVFLSTDTDKTVGYSGKPLITLMGINTSAQITGINLLKHSEPILLGGIPESKIDDFHRQYVNKAINLHFEIGKASSEEGSVDAISGATVTVIAQNQLISRSIKAIARQVGLFEIKVKPPAQFKAVNHLLSWDQLVNNGSIQHLVVKQADLNPNIKTKDIALDLYYGYLNEPTIGKSILGEKTYTQLLSTLGENDHAIFIVANGTESFKGSGFVRGGIYDRIQVSQDFDSYTFRDTDFLNLYKIYAQNAPKFKERGIFIIRDDNFSAAYPWVFAYLGNRIDKNTGNKTFKAFESHYWLADDYLEGGRPVIEREQAAWEKIWWAQKINIIIFVAWIIFVLAFTCTRDIWVRRSSRVNKKWVSIPKYLSWIFAISFVGFYLMAQPSITQVFTIFHTFTDGWNWHLFLLDPYLFIFWWVIIFTSLLWGRGVFCGWMCPFGALSEGLHKIAHYTPLKKYQKDLPLHWHHKLKWLKYIVFVILLLVSFYEISLAERLAEVEPFKTTFLVGFWNRTWPYVLFLAVLLFASLFTERPFCKYLCPLGASLSVPTYISIFGLKLRRKNECTSCRACAKGCGSLAIDKQGKIDNTECMLCMDCMIMYYDDHSCPPLTKERKHRHKNNIPLSPINKHGYFIPIIPEDKQAKTEK